VLSGEIFRLQNLLAGWHLKAMPHFNNLLPTVIITCLRTCRLPCFSKEPIRLLSIYSFWLGCDLRDRQIMVHKPQSMNAVDLFRHIDRQPSLHLCQAVRSVIMLMKRCPQENARYGENGWWGILRGNSGVHHSERISSGSAASIKSNAIRFLMALWKSLMVIPEANAILAILLRPSKMFKIFTISSSRRWSFLGTSPEHRKTRILKLALGFDIGTPVQVFQAGICSKQSMGGLHADLRGLEHKQPHCLAKWQPGCLPRDPWLSVPASQQVWRLTIKK
jgi:hypothetical protein